MTTETAPRRMTSGELWEALRPEWSVEGDGRGPTRRYLVYENGRTIVGTGATPEAAIAAALGVEWEPPAPPPGLAEVVEELEQARDGELFVETTGTDAYEHALALLRPLLDGQTAQSRPEPGDRCKCRRHRYGENWNGKPAWAENTSYEQAGPWLETNAKFCQDCGEALPRPEAPHE